MLSVVPTLLSKTNTEKTLGEIATLRPDLKANQRPPVETRREDAMTYLIESVSTLYMQCVCVCVYV